MRYASKTKVSVIDTRNSIESTLKKYGADRFAYFTEANKAIIVFESNEKRIRFDLPLHGDLRMTHPRIAGSGVRFCCA